MFQRDSPPARYVHCSPKPRQGVWTSHCFTGLGPLDCRRITPSAPFSSGRRRRGVLRWNGHGLRTFARRVVGRRPRQAPERPSVDSAGCRPDHEGGNARHREHRVQQQSYGRSRHALRSRLLRALGRDVRGMGSVVSLYRRLERYIRGIRCELEILSRLSVNGACEARRRAITAYSFTNGPISESAPTPSASAWKFTTTR